jgi:hypothetical protein
MFSGASKGVSSGANLGSFLHPIIKKRKRNKTNIFFKPIFFIAKEYQYYIQFFWAFPQKKRAGVPFLSFLSPKKNRAKKRITTAPPNAEVAQSTEQRFYGNNPATLICQKSKKNWPTCLPMLFCSRMPVSWMSKTL